MAGHTDKSQQPPTPTPPPAAAEEMEVVEEEVEEIEVVEEVIESVEEVVEQEVIELSSGDEEEVIESIEVDPVTIKAEPSSPEVVSPLIDLEEADEREFSE